MVKGWWTEKRRKQCKMEELIPRLRFADRRGDALGPAKRKREFLTTFHFALCTDHFALQFHGANRKVLMRTPANVPSLQPSALSITLLGSPRDGVSARIVFFSDRLSRQIRQ